MLPIFLTNQRDILPSHRKFLASGNSRRFSTSIPYIFDERKKIPFNRQDYSPSFPLLLSLCLLIKLKKKKKKKKKSGRKGEPRCLITFFRKVWRKDKVCLEIELLYSFPFQGFFPIFSISTFHASFHRISIQLEQQFLALPSIQTFLVRCRSGDCLINLRIGQEPPPCHPF